MTNDRPLRVEIDCSTGEAKYIPLTDEEIAEAQKLAESVAQEEAAKTQLLAAKEATRQSAIAKLTALGLTEEEAIALGV